MKRLLSILLSLTVFLTMAVTSVSASTLPTVTVQSIEEAVTIGEEVRLKVSAANNPGFTNFEWKVDYDTDRLELKAFETSREVWDEVEEDYVVTNYLSPLLAVSNVETGKIAAAGSSPCTKKTLFYIIFKVKDKAPSGDAKVSIVSDLCNNDGAPVAFAYVDGTVAIDGYGCIGEHAWGEWQVKTPATCEDEGVAYRVCSKATCGVEETQPIPKLGHSFENSQWQVRTPATCDAYGVEYRVCDRDGCDEEETNLIPKRQHKFEGEWKIKVPATCEQSGIQYRVCAYDDCNEEQTLAYALGGHKYEGEWQTRVPATCEGNGLEYRVCANDGCGQEETRITAVLGHSYGKWTAVDEDSHKKVCANDAAHVITEDHDFVDGFCKDCGQEDTTGDTTEGSGETTGGSGESGGGTGETTGGTGETTGGNSESGGGTGETTGGTGEAPSAGEKEGWDEIKDLISIPQEDTIIVKMNGEQEVPAEVLEKIAETNADVEFKMNAGISWAMKGEDIPENVDLSKINLGVKLNVNTIPEDVVETVEAQEKVQLELAHNGEFGFKMNLNIELGSTKTGLWANLYFFNDAKKCLEFQEAVKIDENGNVKFTFSHASDYVIAIDDESHGTGDTTGGTGETTGGTGETTGGTGETTGGTGETTGGTGETTGGTGETTGGTGETTGGTGETTGGTGETTGGTGETTGGTGETTGGTGETTGGTGETTGGTGETTGGTGETTGGTGETTGGTGETTGGTGETTGGTGETTGGTGETTGGTGETTGGTGETTGGTGETTGGTGETTGGTGETTGGTGETTGGTGETTGGTGETTGGTGETTGGTGETTGGTGETTGGTGETTGGTGETTGGTGETTGGTGETTGGTGETTGGTGETTGGTGETTGGTGETTGGTGETTQVPVTEVKLDKTVLHLIVGDKEVLVATVLPENATDKTVVWTTSDASVATVENGIVTAVAAGRAIIVAKAGEFTVACVVTVEGTGETTGGTGETTGGTGETTGGTGETTGGTGETTGGTGETTGGTGETTGGTGETTGGTGETTGGTGETTGGTGETTGGTGETTGGTGETTGGTGETTGGTGETTGGTGETTGGTGETTGGTGETTGGTGETTGGTGETTGGTGETTQVPVTEVKLNKTVLHLIVGDEEVLIATVLPENATDNTVVWESTNPAVATVDENGIVTAVSVGIATIKATAGNVTTTCEVIVRAATVPVTGVTLDKASATIVVGNATTLIATVAPENATDKTVVWTTSDASVATVENGIVTAVAAGTATITATAGGFSATCVVTVNNPIPPVVAVTGVTLDKTAATIVVGNTTTITATVAPENATDKTVVWTTSDASVATVENGIVTAVAAGTATITATAGGFSATCVVTVNNPVPPVVAVTGVTLDKTAATIVVGNTEVLTATVAPENATDKTVVWTTSDASVATVENGIVTAVAAGTATITATAGGFSATCVVTVNNPASSSPSHSGTVGGLPSSNKYNSVNVSTSTNGTVSISNEKAQKGQKVVINPTPDEGYEVDKITIIDQYGNRFEVTLDENGNYSFEMPEGEVSVEVTYKEIQTEEPGVDAPSFQDVTETDYYYDAVIWAAENGITVGTDEATFSPLIDCTRAQMVTFLWRVAGSPEQKITDTVFTDVDKDAYYYEALLWAIENGITVGTSETTFHPDMVCTRAQMVTFLYRFSGTPEVTGASAFEDVDKDAYYYNAVVWAANEGITVGTSETTFSPDMFCTRAQMVTFLYRLFHK